MEYNSSYGHYGDTYNHICWKSGGFSRRILCIFQCSVSCSLVTFGCYINYSWEMPSQFTYSESKEIQGTPPPPPPPINKKRGKNRPDFRRSPNVCLGSMPPCMHTTRGAYFEKSMHGLTLGIMVLHFNNR